MRPPLNAGENAAGVGALGADEIASMRPPLNAGENALFGSARWKSSSSFNEAPAERGGKPRWIAITLSSASSLQ